MDTNDPFEHFNSLGGGLGLSGFGPQVRPGNTPFRSHSFNIGGHRAGGGPGLGQKVHRDTDIYKNGISFLLMSFRILSEIYFFHSRKNTKILQ